MQKNNNRQFVINLTELSLQKIDFFKIAMNAQIQFK